MEAITINQKEMSALNGLPFIQRLVYLQGIKPYVDYQTSVVGLKRGISYQSLAEVLYIEPHQGFQSGSPSKDQLRRALKGLERAGLIEVHSDKKLIFKCLLLDQSNFIQNKATTNPHHPTASPGGGNTIDNSMDCSENTHYAAIPKRLKPTIPLNSSNNNIFLFKQFELFWSLYPLKNSEQKAWQVFQELNPSEVLITEILSALQNQLNYVQHQQALGKWVPNWKNPANWLTQRCWNDVIPTEQPTQANYHAKNKFSSRKEQATDSLWALCKPDSEEQKNVSNVIEIARWGR